MASERQISIRLTVRDAAKVRAELTKLGEDGQAAVDRIDKALTSVGPNLDKVGTKGTAAIEKVGAASRHAGSGVGVATREFRALFDELTSGRTRQAPGTLAIIATQVFGIGGAALGAAVAIGAIPGALAYAAYVGAESLKKLDNALKLTGNASGETRDGLEGIAQALAESGQVNVITAREGLAELVTSGRLAGDVLKGVAEVSRDFARLTGEEFTKVVADLGKAFADPVKGAKELDSALNFLTDSQLQQIDTLTRQGDKYAAQKVLLEALRDRTKGAGEEVGILTRAWNALASAIVHASHAAHLDGQPETPSEAVARLTRERHSVATNPSVSDREKRAASGGWGWIPFDQQHNPAGGDTAAGKARLQKIDQDLKDALDAQQAAAVAAAWEKLQAELRELGKQSGEAARSIDTLAAKEKTLHDQEVLLRTAIADGLDTDGSRAKALAQVRYELAHLDQPVAKYIRQMQEEGRVAATTGAEHAKAIALMRLEQQAAAEHRVATAAEKAQVAALAVANHQAAEAIKDRAEAVKLAIRQEQENEKAIEDGFRKMKEEAARRATTIHDLAQEVAQRQAMLDALRQGNEAYEKQAALRDIVNKIKGQGAPLDEAELARAKALADHLGHIKAETDRVKESQRDMRSAMNDATRVISTGFEDAILKGQGFRSVLQGIVKDLAQILLRLTVTKPLENALQDALGGGGSGAGGGSLLSGAGGLFGLLSSGYGALPRGVETSFASALAGGIIPLADGGPFQAGQTLLVGEQGPEIMRLGTGGSVTPNHRLGGTTNVYNIDARGAAPGVEQSILAALKSLDRSIEPRAVAAVRGARLRNPGLLGTS